MATQENSESIFSGLKKSVTPGAAAPAAPAAREASPPPPQQPPAAWQQELQAPPPPRPANSPPPPLPPLPPPPAPDARIPALEAALLALREEIQVIKSRPEPAALPPAEGGSEAFGPRLVRMESLMAELRLQIATCDENSKARAADAAPVGEIRNLDIRLSDLAAAYDGLKRTFAREAELAARLDRSERALAELKTQLAGQQAQVRSRLDELAPGEEVDALRVNLSEALGSLEEMKRALALRTEEFSGVESECRRALGEMRGLVKSAEQKPMSEKFDEYLKESVARLAVRLAEVETAMHAGLAELSGKVMSGEILYQKVFSEAEERLIKSVEPELKSVDGQLKWLRENLIRLSDDYSVVAARKMRALEGKYSAFEAIARRMDAIDAALKKSGRIGLP